jgi:hypothetical protein
MISRLFIEIYLDEDVDILIAHLIRARGFQMQTTREAGNLSTSDAEQLAYAAGREKTLLTHNRADFEALHQHYYDNGWEHDGIIIAVRHSPHEIVRRLLIVLNNVTADEMHNQLRYI